MRRKLSTTGLSMLASVSLIPFLGLLSRESYSETCITPEETIIFGEVIPPPTYNQPTFTPAADEVSFISEDIPLADALTAYADTITTDIESVVPISSEDSLVISDLSENSPDTYELSGVYDMSNTPLAEDTYESDTETQRFEVGEICDLPNLPTRVKACTDYRCYNIPSTPHWRLQQCAWTDEYGLRRFNDDYIVGLGTYYSTDIGDRFEITLDTGRVFTIILGDNKADCDTDETNRYKPCSYYNPEDANVLEFIADFDVMPDWVYARGTIDCLDDFSGNIAQIKYIGRDNSADWDSYI